MEDEKQNSPSLVSADEIRNGFNTEIQKVLTHKYGMIVHSQIDINFIRRFNCRYGNPNKIIQTLYNYIITGNFGNPS